MRVDGWRRPGSSRPASGEVLISTGPTLSTAPCSWSGGGRRILLALVVVALLRRRTTPRPRGAGRRRRPAVACCRLAAVVADLLALGVAGVVGVLLGQRTTSRPRLRRAAAAAGVLVATAAAVVAPWPVGTTYSEGWRVGAALAASADLLAWCSARCAPRPCVASAAMRPALSRTPTSRYVTQAIGRVMPRVPAASSQNWPEKYGMSSQCASMAQQHEVPEEDARRSGPARAAPGP